MKLSIALLTIIFTNAIITANASNILGLFLTYSPSHLIIHMSIIRALVEKGHNVTVITSMPLKDKNPQYRHIFLKNLDVSAKEITRLVNDMKDAPAHLKIIKTFSATKTLFDRYSQFTKDPDFISFMKEDNQFDLMLHGYGFNEYQLGVAAHFKCPVVMSWVLQPFGYLNRLIGNPTHPEFVPFALMDPKPMDFSRRVIGFLANIVERIFSGVFGILIEQVYNENYPSDKYPTLTEMQNNISLVLFNHHFSEGPVRPLVPGMVEIGGIQIKEKPDPLPDDVAKFLENSSKGAIFFSLGSNVKADHLDPNFIPTVYKTLSNLPYNVIWKFDSDQFPGNSSNILFKKWLPQDDILAHGNLKLFITHAGKGSVTESEYHQVPMVALPVYGDQPTNADKIQAKGHGLALDIHSMTENSFKEAVLEVMENDKYRNIVRQFSELYRDRPLTARQNTVYWIEYVIRHKGAPHMQSPLKRMNILQENSIDVIVFLSVVAYLVFKLIKVLILVLILINGCPGYGPIPGAAYGCGLTILAISE
ncbi:UDP-glycosyltransferase UGT5-like [Episyrphus balteatus]|uniref:UDP-glycosyltransferase UGT5-like n=1 Tax=Episyrphus balteatus TaxID=286459 RepID=UPI002486BD3F|nr:UDP-glycosyltransferase UGT5-like [Episyrphus balteatus]